MAEYPAVKWTEARKDVLRQMYPRGDSGEDIAAAVNALPGEAATPNQCAFYANYLGLRRPKPAAPPPAPPRPASGTAGTARRAELPAGHPDKEEARKLFQAGSSARDIAAEFGLPLGTVSNWVVEWRLVQRAAGAT